MDWRLTEIKEGDLILDVGSGKPIDAIRATWFGANFIALDLSRQDLAIGRNFIKRELPHLYGLVDFVVAAATMLPFKDNAFDTTTSYSAIEHVAGLENHKKWIT